MQQPVFGIGRLLDGFRGFGEDEFDVSRVGHVRVDLKGQRHSTVQSKP